MDRQEAPVRLAASLLIVQPPWPLSPNVDSALATPGHVAG
jgi:hypothetical protein